MKRRTILGGIPAFLAAKGDGNAQGSPAKPAIDRIGALAGMTLDDLREQYRSDLYDEFLPFVERYVIDREYGGFMCGVDRDGVRIDTGEGTWDQGRGIWIFSFLYNNIDPDPKWLEVARKAADFILKIRPKGDAFWHRQLTREGELVGEPDTVIYSDIYIAYGLQEYSRAAGGEYWDIAREILLKCVDIYDNRTDYASLKPNGASPGVVRPRILSHWFQLGRLASHMLDKKSDPRVEAVRDRCIDAFMNAHFNPGFRLITEYVNHDLSPIDGDYGQEIANHAQEVLWLVMNEAVRRKDRQLFETAAERFKRHVEVLWDDVYGGLFTLKHADNNVWSTGKPLWMDNGDRKVTFDPHTRRVGIFQQPRHLMLNLLALDRIIKNGGKVSGLFSRL